MDEEKELRKNKQLEENLLKEIKNFQNIYSLELMTLSKSDMLMPFNEKIKVSRIGVIKEKLKKFFNKLINCI